MLIIPAIDIRKGKCVRLFQGDMGMETVYSHDPIRVASEWEDQGAPFLHIIDLDGAFSGTPKNLNIVKKIKEKTEIPLQLGGGIRDLETIENILSQGIDRVILGTAAADTDFLEEAHSLYREKIVVGVDIRKGKIAIKGWKSLVERNIAGFIKDIQDIGIARVIFTDTSRDGTLRGPNIDIIKDFLEAVDLKVIIAGGMASLANLKQLLQLEYPNFEGVILGKSLYDGNIDLKEALDLVKQKC
ncbi:MAG: 1-(5-phosphoribosyl)-5-[(5-phosphoribosylamino)methylideneamino]imidazole-4-carboxamide isomerase [Clostridia bacterium]|nr:1-(5-phosphoribosyl)-5-[(5-phosphoribosylamino)methylideneamino]imidazole-4-carboxamide isomerase [Clostridia bacterium]